MLLAGTIAAQGAERIVSIGGAVTETIHALGAGARITAVDSTSTYPAAMADLPQVGYMRQLSAEPIIALDPTLVLAVADAGPDATLEQLRAAGVRLITVPDEPSPDGVVAKVEAVAKAVGLEDEGEVLTARLMEDFAALDKVLAAVDHRPSVLFLLSVGRGAPLAAGRDTPAASIIALAGGRNAIDAFDGFRPLTAEAAIAAAPDVLLVSESTLDLLGGQEALLARPEVAATPAGRAGRVIAMDGMLLLGFGPRTPLAIRSLARHLHPGLPLPQLVSQ